MEFNTDMEAAPRDKELLLRHREWGIGVGAMRTVPGVTQLHVTFACKSLMSGMTGVSMPSPVEFEDFTGWADYPHDRPDVREVFNQSIVVRILEKAKYASTYCDEHGMTSALEEIAGDALTLLAHT